MSDESNYETIEVDISDEELLALAKMAHERDITFNQLVNEILLKKMKEQEEK
jgi:predicted DNA-binding ribbon-helix-helix protein